MYAWILTLSRPGWLLKDNESFLIIFKLFNFILDDCLWSLMVRKREPKRQYSCIAGIPSLFIEMHAHM